MGFVKGKGGNATTDKVYTPEKIAKLIISKFPLYGKVLDALRLSIWFPSVRNSYPKGV